MIIYNACVVCVVFLLGPCACYFYDIALVKWVERAKEGDFLVNEICAGLTLILDIGVGMLIKGVAKKFSVWRILTISLARYLIDGATYTIVRVVFLAEGAVHAGYVFLVVEDALIVVDCGGYFSAVCVVCFV